MGTLTCKIRQRVQKLPGGKSRCLAQKQRKLETFKIRVTCQVGSFNQRARDSSSLERTKNPRRIERFFVGFSFFWRSAHLCTLFAHRRESRVFLCIVCILCIVSELVGARPLHLARARPFCRLKAPLGLSLLRKRELTIVFQANSSRVNSRRCSGFICRTTVSITSGVI